MSDNWPDDDALLQLVKESQEHQRSWALIRGLSKRLLDERGSESMLRKAGGIEPHHNPKITEPRPEGYLDKIRILEEKIVKQKHELTTIYECREFERETERLLVATLQRIATVYGGGGEAMRDAAEGALREYSLRLGPRQ